MVRVLSLWERVREAEMEDLNALTFGTDVIFWDGIGVRSVECKRSTEKDILLINGKRGSLLILCIVCVQVLFQVHRNVL